MASILLRKYMATSQFDSSIHTRILNAQPQGKLMVSLSVSRDREVEHGVFVLVKTLMPMLRPTNHVTATSRDVSMQSLSFFSLTNH